MRIIITLCLILSSISANAECRRDTVYVSQIENNVTYPQKRIINQFNTNNKVIATTEQSWNTSTKQYDNWQKQLFTYKANGIVIEYIEQSWNFTKWEDRFRSTSTIDANGNITENLTQKWDRANNTWTDQSKYVSSYDSKNNKILVIGYEWNYSGNKTWDFRRKDSSVYDANKNETEYYHYNWDKTTKKWGPSSLTTYKYNSHNDITTMLELGWYMNQWDSTYRTNYTYNSNYQVTQELVERWDETFGLNDYLKIVYSYNSSNNIKEIIELNWNPVDMVWDNYRKETYTYDSNNNLILKSVFLGWNKNNNAYLLETKEDYKCALISGIEDAGNTQIRVFPNPAYSNSISVTLLKDSKYELIDVIGNIVQYGNLVEGENVVALTESLQNGSYFLRINDTIQKLIIHR